MINETSLLLPKKQKDIHRYCVFGQKTAIKRGVHAFKDVVAMHDSVSSDRKMKDSWIIAYTLFYFTHFFQAKCHLTLTKDRSEEEV